MKEKFFTKVESTEEIDLERKLKNAFKKRDKQEALRIIKMIDRNIGVQGEHYRQTTKDQDMIAEIEKFYTDDESFIYLSDSGLTRLSVFNDNGEVQISLPGATERSKKIWEKIK